MIKPTRLKPGDRIAAVSLSWGGPATYPERYQVGKEQFEAEFGLEVIEMPHALRSAAWLAENPKARAEDLMQAVTDDSIRGIVCTVGGDDSIRTLPFIDIGLAQNVMFDAAPPAWGRYLPAHGAMRVLTDGAFTPGFDEAGPLVLALGWLAGLTVLAAFVFRRGMTR